MPKPLIVPRFDTNQTNITAPSSALADDGWPDDDIPTAGNFNWLFYWGGEWFNWLNAGNLGDVTLSSLHVTGAAVIDGGVAVTGGMTIAGDLILTGELDVSGPASFEDYIQINEVKHGEYRATLPAVLLPTSQNMGMSLGNPYKVTSSGTAPWYYHSVPVSMVGLRQGDRVTKVRVRFENNTPGAQVNAYLHHYRFDFGVATTATGNSTAAQGHITFNSVSGQNTIDEHDSMLDVIWVEVNGSSTTNVAVSIDIYWDRP